MTTTKFFDYLNNLGLFRISIYFTESGIEAIVSKNIPPKVENFTQVTEEKFGYKVRLSKKDYFNTDITNGFFN